MLTSWLPVCVLASLLYPSSATVLPQQTSYYTNSTRPSQTIGPTPAPTAFQCPASCSPILPEVSRIIWQKLFYTENVTAATVLQVVNNRTNTTTTTTVFNELPSGYTLPETNEAGTAVTTVIRSYPPTNTTISTVIAYPSVFYDYDSYYYFDGTLPTLSGTSSLCSTATQSGRIDLSSHPPYYLPTSDPVFPRDGDQFGTDFAAAWLCANSGKQQFWQENFPEEAAFRLCQVTAVQCGASFIETARFLTETSVIYETGIGSPPSTRSPAPTPTSVAGLPIVTSPPRGGGPSVVLTRVEAGREQATGTASPVPPDNSQAQETPNEASESQPIQVVGPNRPETPLPQQGENGAPGGPDAQKPGDSEPGTAEPGTDEPGTDEPGTDEPGTVEPGTVEPEADNPVAPQRLSEETTPGQSPEGQQGQEPGIPVILDEQGVPDGVISESSQSIIVGSQTLSVGPIAVPDDTSGTSLDISGVALGTQTASIGQTLIIDNTPVVVTTSSSLVAVVVGSGSSLSTLLVTPAPGPTQTVRPVIVGNPSDGADSASTYVIAGQTILPGQTMTLEAGPSSTIVFVNDGSSAPTGALDSAPVLTIAGQTYSVNSDGVYVLEGQTPGPTGTATSESADERAGQTTTATGPVLFQGAAGKIGKNLNVWITVISMAMIML